MIQTTDAKPDFPALSEWDDHAFAAQPVPLVPPATSGARTTVGNSGEAPRPLRILVLNWRCFRHAQAGGAEQNLYQQARRWAAQGHDVTLVCADPGRAQIPARNEDVEGITIRRMGGRFGVYPRAALYVLRHGHRFDRILDIANGIPFFTPLFTRTPQVLFVHHVHERQWFSEFPTPVARVGWFLEHRVVPRLYRRRPVVAVSPTTSDALVAIGFDPSLVSVIYNGVEMPVSPVSPVSPLLPMHTAPRIAYVGRLKRYKRLDLLVRAVAELRAEFPDLRLDIAGDGDARPDIAALVEGLGLQEHVTLHGFVDDGTKAALLRSASVFATPSMHEGWGLSVIEANAHGCPAVAYDVPGLRVAVRHGETGLLATDAAGFRAALALLLHDHDLRRRLSDNARAWAASFDWDSCATETLQVLRASGPTVRSRRDRSGAPTRSWITGKRGPLARPGLSKETGKQRTRPAAAHADDGSRSG